jgi:hypothetical protein
VLDIPGAGPPRDENHDDQQRQVLLAIFVPTLSSLLAQWDPV